MIKLEARLDHQFKMHHQSPSSSNWQFDHLRSLVTTNDFDIKDSGRILDIPCKVCGDYSSGKHYNIFACDGCAGFFKRSIRRNRQYVCKGKKPGSCVMDKTHRNQCRACRLQKCQQAGMNKDAVQHERGPRNSTIQRAMTTFFEQQQRNNSVPQTSMVPIMSPGSDSVLNLSLSKAPLSPNGSLIESIYPMTMIPPSPGLFYPGMIMPRIPPMVHFPPQVISPPVTPPPAPLTLETICESAARLLFMNVQWTKSLVSFTTLPLEDQLVLLEEGWKELFVLAAAQFLPLTDFLNLAASSFNDGDKDKTEFLKKVQDFQETLANAKHFQMDHHEFACLRIITLFKTAFTINSESPKSFKDPVKIQSIQNDTQLTLNKYLSTTKPEQPLRFGKMLLLLSNVRNVNAETIEELFFKKTIGNIPIVKIICDMYKSQPEGTFIL